MTLSVLPHSHVLHPHPWLSQLHLLTQRRPVQGLTADVLTGSFTLAKICLPSLYSQVIACLCVLFLGEALLPHRALETLLYRLQELMVAMEKAGPQPDLPQTPTGCLHGLSLSWKFPGPSRPCPPMNKCHRVFPEPSALSVCTIIFSSFRGKLSGTPLGTSSLSLAGSSSSGNTFQMLTLEYLCLTLMSSDFSLIAGICLCIHLSKAFLYFNFSNFDFNDRFFLGTCQFV